MSAVFEYGLYALVERALQNPTIITLIINKTRIPFDYIIYVLTLELCPFHYSSLHLKLETISGRSLIEQYKHTTSGLSLIEQYEHNLINRNLM